ncbi:MAG: TonB C-terminal domain-containing protein [Verrucomicrobiota bacterium]|jgi:outer membrane biosynthesis protein TonB
MVPQTKQRKPRNSSKVNLLISLAFHGVIILALVFFAARQGLLGKQIKKIAVEMVREKPPQKPKEPEKPKEEPPKVEPPKLAETPKIESPRETAPPPASLAMAAPPAMAPAPVDVSSFVFEGGKAVETSSDPVQLYKGSLEYLLRSRWDRPTDLDDQSFVAEVEVSVDHSGQIANPVWKKGSGDKRWDDSVRQALARTRSASRPPPANFPPRVLVRFDVVATEPIVQ